jgi:hypothetical protein
MDADGDNATFTREVGYAATQAIKAFGDGNYPEAVRLLRPVRNYAHRFGGSHAQRDVIDLTLIEAASRAGQHRLAAALLAERANAHGSPLTWLKVADANEPAATLERDEPDRPSISYGVPVVQTAA